jgi:serine/threonine protein kinase/heat shock protein HslJ
MTDLIGQRIDNFRIDDELDGGGMGTVYLAYDVNLDERVALKVMHPHLARQSQFQQRFLDEARSAARLRRHPSIVNIRHVGQTASLLYMVMDYVPGGSLKNHIQELIKSGRTLPLQETLILLAQVSEAAGYAHQQGIVHRDMKPENVLLMLDNGLDGLPFRAVVTDFGLAKLLEKDGFTKPGMVLGTLPYMSPEQFRGRDVDGRSDIYSIGIMLYQLTTNRLPFDIDSVGDAAEKHMREVPPRPREIRPELPLSVETIISKAIAKKPADRYQTAEAMASSMRQATENLTDAEATRLVATGNSISIITQIQSFSNIDEPSQTGEDLTALPGQDRLLLTHAGKKPESIPLLKEYLTIGRSKNNDLVLDDNSVSRQHVRLNRTSAGGWQIVDQGSTNGTFLDKTRLLANIPFDWTPGAVLQVGDFFLRLQQMAGQSEKPYPDRTWQGSQPFGASTIFPSGATIVRSESGLLSVGIQPESLEVSPGGQANVRVDMVNVSSQVDHFKLVVEDLQPNWITIPQEGLQLMPGASGSLSFSIRPPMDSSSAAGPHKYSVVVHSTTNPNEKAWVGGTVNVKPFEQFSIDMRPMKLKDGGISRVMVRNDGNSQADFRIGARDPGESITFFQQQDRLTLGPGTLGTVDLNLKAKERSFLGSTKTQPFEVRVSTASGQHQTLSGQLEIQPVIPPWLIPLFMILGVVLCLSAFGLYSFISGQNEQATQTAVALLAATSGSEATLQAQQTMIAMLTQNASDAAAGMATSQAQTAEAGGDNDGDGLSNSQEIELGTNPDNPDTDGDGLNDGQEVNQFGTNPRQSDHDGDTLLDGAEVNVHHTSPTNPDTDGDGTPDGVEVNQGSDPLAQPSATPAPTNTTVATNTPTATPTSTPTPTPDTNLADTEWVLESFTVAGADTPVVGDRPPTLNLDTAGQASGTGGCNVFSGSYETEGITITFTGIITTLIACLDPAVGQQESRYLGALEEAESFSKTVGTLTIFYDNGQSSLHFVMNDEV